MTNESELNILKAKIQTELVLSGQYDQISKFLRFKLLENGWYDEVKQMSTRSVSQQEQLNYNSLLKELEPKLLQMVPDSVKEETLLKIKLFLETVVED